MTPHLNDVENHLDLALGTTYLVLGTWHQVLSTWYQVPGTWYQVLGTRYEVHGTKYLVLGTGCQVLGTCDELMSQIRQVTISMSLLAIQTAHVLFSRVAMKDTIFIQAISITRWLEPKPLGAHSSNMHE